MAKNQLVIAEDNEFFREILGQILTAQDGLYAIAGEAANGADAITLVRQLAPDMLVLDLQMPKVDGFEVLSTVRKTNQDLKILVLTMSRSQTMLQKALQHGADGYCTKTSGKDIILKAVEQVSKGNRFISPDMNGHSRSS